MAATDSPKATETSPLLGHKSGVEVTYADSTDSALSSLTSSSLSSDPSDDDGALFTRHDEEAAPVKSVDDGPKGLSQATIFRSMLVLILGMLAFNLFSLSIRSAPIHAIFERLQLTSVFVLQRFLSSTSMYSLWWRPIPRLGLSSTLSNPLAGL